MLPIVRCVLFFTVFFLDAARWLLLSSHPESVLGFFRLGLVVRAGQLCKGFQFNSLCFGIFENLSSGSVLEEKNEEL